MTIKFDMAGVRVMLAMPTHRDIPPLVVRSLLEIQAECLIRGIHLNIQMQTGSSLVHHARTKAANVFLESDCNRLFWMDSDIVCSAKEFLRLLALSTKMECVAAIYTCKCDPPSFCLNVDDIGAIVETNEYGCLPLHGGGLGLGCTVVHRSIIEDLATRAPLARFPDIDRPVPYIFRCDVARVDANGIGYARGEDMAFFADIRDLGYSVNLDPSVTLGHVGAKTYSASFMDILQQMKA